MSEHGRWVSQAAFYALDALAADERAAFESHLTACALCRAELRAHTEVAGALACAARALPAPGSLRARVLADARRVRPIGLPAPDGNTVPARPAAPLTLHAETAGASAARRTPRLTAAAGIVLAIAGLSLYQVRRRARAHAEQRRAAVDSARTSAERMEAQLAQRDSAIDAIMEGGRALTLAARGRTPSARMHWNRARGHIVIAARDLPPAGTGRTYQLWAIREGEPASLGTFDTDARGRATVLLRVDSALSFDVTAVTEEPAGGSPLPTTTPLLLGEWPTR